MSIEFLLIGNDNYCFANGKNLIHHIRYAAGGKMLIFNSTGISIIVVLQWNVIDLCDYYCDMRKK